MMEFVIAGPDKAECRIRFTGLLEDKKA